MQLNMIIIDISIILFLITVLVATIVFWIEYRNGEKIRKKTYELRQLTDEKVEEYIAFIGKIQVPYLKIYRDILRAGYRLVHENENVNQELKVELRKVILSKGILI